MPTLTDAELEAILGPVGIREFNNAPDWAKPKLRDWVAGLADRDDDDFLGEAASAIHGSALAQSFRGNYEHEHCKATAVYRASKRRHEAEGHDPMCRGDSIYARAHANVMRSQGHTPSEPQDCTCGAGR